MRQATVVLVLAIALFPAVAAAQTAKVTHNVNLRPDPSSEYPATRLPTTSEPALTLLDPAPESGYYHVKTSNGEEGYVDGLYVSLKISASESTELFTRGGTSRKPFAQVS